jgi:hypothetical protein
MRSPCMLLHALVHVLSLHALVHVLSLYAAAMSLHTTRLLHYGPLMHLLQFQQTRWFASYSRKHLASAIAGVLTLDGPQEWSGRLEPLPGKTTLQAASPFAAVDFQNARDVFSLLELETGGKTYPAALQLLQLRLSNLPASSAGSGTGSSIRALSALLWMAKTPQARTMNMQPIYILNGVTVATSCSEVAFLRGFFKRLQDNTAGRSAMGLVELVRRASVPSLFASCSVAAAGVCIAASRPADTTTCRVKTQARRLSSSSASRHWAWMRQTTPSRARAFHGVRSSRPTRTRS